MGVVRDSDHVCGKVSMSFEGSKRFVDKEVDAQMQPPPAQIQRSKQ